jgi:ABC-type spermidine/putrescine transport system permease subunit I
MRKLKIKSTRFKKFCNYNTLSNSRDWWKVIRVKLKFGANLSFSHPLSPMPNVFFFSRFLKNLTPFMTKQGYWSCVFHTLWISLLCHLSCKEWYPWVQSEEVFCIKN